MKEHNDGKSLSGGTPPEASSGVERQPWMPIGAAERVMSMNKSQLSLQTMLAVFLLLLSRPIDAKTYNSNWVSFNSWPAWTAYGKTQVEKDFGNYKVLQGGNRLSIDKQKRLRFYLPKGSLGSSQGGGIIKSSIVKKNNYSFSFDIRFDSRFPWSKGGKIPGLSGGKGYTAGNPAWNGDGFSIRIMWREGGRLIPYVYHMDQPGKYGDTFGSTIGYINSKKKFNIKYWVKLNNGNKKDGILKIFIDNILRFEKRNIRFKNDDSKIDTAHISVFPGGGTDDWKMTGDGYIRIDNIKWQ
ncbi:polysaccharide lyase [Oceanisphaera sp.]|uniref:polysaccharide lyase n=1 Tax=Oceanisphaera sp. TaxID=1929979 RepID=UPI003A940E4C